MDNECIICGGPVFILGTLGDRVHVRCRHCGMDQSQDLEVVEIERWEEEEEEEYRG